MQAATAFGQLGIARHFHESEQDSDIPCLSSIGVLCFLGLLCCKSCCDSRTRIKYQQIIHVLFNEFNVSCSSCSNQMIVSHDERNPQAPMACTDNDCFLPDGRDPSPRKKT